jgi:hypothetical protein
MNSGKPLGQEVLLDITAADELTEFFELLAIVESENGWHCMCDGEHALELRDNDGAVLAVLGLHHGSSIRWDEWSSDGQLAKRGAIFEWMARRGVTGPFDRYEEEKRDQQEAVALEQSWIEAAPEAVQDLVPHMLGSSRTGSVDPELLRRARSQPEISYPESADRAWVLLRWNAAGSGRCSGHPSHERFPQDLLLTIDTTAVVQAIEENPEDLEAWQGAVRYFAGWDFRSRRNELLVLTPETRERLLAVAENSGDQDKLSRAQRALQP